MTGAEALELALGLEASERHAAERTERDDQRALKLARADALRAACQLLRARLANEDTAKHGICGACRAKLSAAP